VAGPRGRRLAGPVGGSLALHAVGVAAFFVTRTAPTPPSPPSYHVSIVAAPPGARAAGVVRAPDVPSKAPAPAPGAALPTPVERAPAPVKSAPVPAKAPPSKLPAPAPTKAPPRAAPAAATPAPTPAAPKPAGANGTTPGGAPPRAGGGPVGGAGTDVATVRTEGIDFPYPLYLQNIVRQIALNFPAQSASLTAEVRFLVHRDGTVSDVSLVRRSGNFRFDFDARGAVEAAAPRFGRLPDGFRDDVLPVLFSFDPRVFRR